MAQSDRRSPFDAPQHYASRDGSPITPELHAQLKAPADGIRAVCLLNLLALFVIAMYTLVDIADTFFEDSVAGVETATGVIPGACFMFMQLIVSAFTLRVATQMRSFEEYHAARIICVIGIIPVLSPAVVFTIPFALWALIRLSEPRIREAFRS